MAKIALFGAFNFNFQNPDVIGQFGHRIRIQHNKMGNDQSHFGEKKVHSLSNCVIDGRQKRF